MFQMFSQMNFTFFLMLSLATFQISTGFFMQRTMLDKKILGQAATSAVKPAVTTSVPYQAHLLREYFKVAHICHDRFVRCAQLLHPSFCVPSGNGMGFFIWAKRLATNILQAPGVHCPEQMMQQFYQQYKTN